MPRRSVYDRVAAFYDLMQAPMDLLGGARRRERVVKQAVGRTLEVGIGTGINFELYSRAADVTGIDLSDPMLARARQRAAQLGRSAGLVRGDVEELPFPAASFDTVLATCVFCSVADPVRGLREVGRVVKPGGKVLLLEHVRPRNPLLARLADVLSPITRRLMGPELNRRTEENVVRAGLEIVSVLRQGVWREVVAVPAAESHPVQPS